MPIDEALSNLKSSGKYILPQEKVDLKAHFYEIMTYSSVFDKVHNQGQKQIRVLIPEKAFFGYREIGKIDFFKTDEESLKRAEEQLLRATSQTADELIYLHTKEIDSSIEDFIEVGKQKNDLDELFDTASQIFFDLV
jgi:hypothetical protein